MKKVILATALVVFGLNVHAQETDTSGGFAKGDLFISGSVGFNSTKTGGAKTSEFEIAPAMGYFISENIALGLQLGYISSKSEMGALKTEDISAFSVGAFGRYYFMPASQFSLFGQLGVAYISANDDLNDMKANGFGAGFMPGISYFVSGNFALEATVGILGYSSIKPDFDGAEATKTFDFGVNMRDINIGVVYKF